MFFCEDMIFAGAYFQDKQKFDFVVSFEIAPGAVATTLGPPGAHATDLFLIFRGSRPRRKKKTFFFLLPPPRAASAGARA